MAIARALAVDAKIVIADRAIGNLDEENTQEVISIFQELAHEVGRNQSLLLPTNQTLPKLLIFKSVLKIGSFQLFELTVKHIITR